MKKKMVVLIPMMFLLVGCSWFNKSTDIKDVYLNVLKNELTFINVENEEKYFKSYTDNNYTINRYAMIDMENDDTKDMIVEIVYDGGKISYVLLSRQGSKIYCYDIKQNDASLISKKGYFAFSKQDSYGIQKITIKKTKIDKEVLFEKKYEKDECIINKVSGSCEDYNSAVEEFSATMGKEIEWTNYTA